MKNAVEIKNLEKIYPNFSLKIESLNFPSGTIIGLIGENGAGKTTLIKLILNIIKKDSGKIKINGKNLEKNEQEIKEEIGIVLDNSFFPEILSPKNINSVMQSTYKNWDKKLFYEYLKKFKIKDNQTLKSMSKGMRKKVEIATALSHHPKLLILDEATSGLDPVVRNEILGLFSSFVKDESHTIILSSHITSDLEKIASHIIFINGGKIVLESEKEKILKTTSLEDLMLSIIKGEK